MKGVIKCNKNNKDKVLEEIEKLPNKYNKITKPNGTTDNNENITIEAQ